MIYKNKFVAPFVLATLSTSIFAVDYNDPYWSSPDVNADFVDHFNSTQLDRKTWKVETDIFVNGEDIDYQDVEFPAADWTIRTGQPDAGALDGAVLNLKARYMDGEIQDLYNKDGKPLFIRSGRIESRITDDTTFTYGKFEARIKMPPARHAEFPAWWLLGNYPDVGWTACQELDIVEFTGANPDLLPQTFWTAPYPVHGGVGLSYKKLGIENPSDTYNTYGVIKTPDKVEWYVNGELTQTFSRENQGDDQPWPYVTPMRMILNHAISHIEWPDVGHYMKWSTNANVANATGGSYVDENGVTQYEYVDTALMEENIGRAGTNFKVDYVAHWPLPSNEPTAKYVDDSKSSFFRKANNTKGFYNLKGWLPPVSVTGDAFLDQGGKDDERDNGVDNAADGYVGSKWATPADDKLHWIEVDYGANKNVDYLWLEWGWNLPAAYDIYGKTTNGDWQLLAQRTQSTIGWATHTIAVNQRLQKLKLVTKGRIDKANPIWLLELKAFESVADMYPMPAGTVVLDPTVNVITNGDFNDGLSAWKTEQYNGADPSFTVNNRQKLLLSLTKSGLDLGSVQLHQSGFVLQRDHRYELSFDARGVNPRDMVVRVSQDDLNPADDMIFLKETLNLQTSMQKWSFEFDYTGTDSAGRLAFLMGNLGSESLVIDNVVLRDVGYFGIGDPLVSAMDATNLISASAGWETEWWGVASRAIDGSTGSRASGNDGVAEGKNLSIKVRIPAHYEIKELLVAGDQSPERSLDSFKVKYGDNQTMLDWTKSYTDGVYETFSRFDNKPPVGERDFQFIFRPPAGQLVEVSDVKLMAIDHKPYTVYTIALDEGGDISPVSGRRYSKNGDDTATYFFNAIDGYEVADVLIDGESKGAIEKFTFRNIKDSHSIAVSFRKASEKPVTNIARSATITATSELQSATRIADGDRGTRWESEVDKDKAAVFLDFGQRMSLQSSKVFWEAANAETYVVQGSTDGSTWTTLYKHQGGAFGDRVDSFDLSGTYRYVKIVGQKKSQGNYWGYSIFEWQVFGRQL